MRIFCLSILFSVMALICASGCASHAPSVNTLSNAEQSGQPTRIADQRVVTDNMLANVLWVTEVRESKTNDGFKRIQIFLKNLSTAPFTFSYRFNWYDENGVEVEAADDELWKKVHAVPGDDVTITSVAPQPNCADFKARIVSRF